ncbi:hypothetical protein A2335_01665 [Candidatus Peregrinibacteria bacterium RIFOXYB2_FULL_32_7]|nr:MAG: hypothetical protein A2335_01665 [Candidatus Peregrinibacteria bacterium RIFOXYB2_FULL_32_7]
MESLSLLGIDFWSVFLYIFNFGLILFVVWKFFTNPIIETIDKRRNQIKNNIEEADKLKNELAKQKEMMEKEKEVIRLEMEDQMNELRKDLEKKRKDAEAEIEAQRNKMIEEVRRAIEEQKKSIKDDVKKDMIEMVQRMVLYIVSNKIPQDIVRSSVNEAWEIYKK